MILLAKSKKNRLRARFSMIRWLRDFSGRKQLKPLEPPEIGESLHFELPYQLINDDENMIIFNNQTVR